MEGYGLFDEYYYLLFRTDVILFCQVTFVKLTATHASLIYFLADVM